MTIFGTLEIGRSALRAQHKGMEVSGQNVANANTPGYTRQRADLESVVPAIAPGVEMSPGRGVEVDDVTRMKSEFYHTQKMQAGSHRAHWEMRKETLNGVEQVFKEPGEHGLGEQIAEFFDTWSELSSNPESTAVRKNLQEYTHTLTGAFQDNYQRLDDLRGNTVEDLEMKVDDLNQTLDSIAEINDELVYLEGLGEKSNELKDELDRHLEDLSELINIRVHRKDNGAVEVYTSGRLLVQDTEAQHLELQENEEGKMELLTRRGQEIEPASGKLRGSLESVNEIIPNLQGEVDKIATNLAERINELHRDGYGLDDEEGGNNFFQELDEDSELPPSLQLELDPKIDEDSDLIAASSAPGEPGNNEMAKEISQVRDEELINNANVNDYYRGIVSSVGVEGQEAQRMADTLEETEKELHEQDQSVSGVNIDEEMLDMMEFQHAWHGASRFLSYVDEMIGVLFNELQ